jgi:murein DD-endopeptidase MepM/ murein hydrolase activator NlpD
LGLLSSVGVLTGGMVFAQTPPSSSTDAVPSASDLLGADVHIDAAPQAPAAPVIQNPEPASIPEPQAAPQEPSPQENSAASPQPTTVGTPAHVPALDASDLDDTPQVVGDFSSPYIDTTNYNLGATYNSDQPTVVFSERSTGCQAVLQRGQSVPASLCQTASGGGQRPGRVNSISVGPITLSPNGIRLNGGSAQNYYNLSPRPAGLPGNGNIALIFPLSVPEPITSLFGWRMHPIHGDMRFHSGTDIGAPMGTPVLAAYSGQVAIASMMRGYGLAIVVQHGDTQQTLYAHLSEIYVRPGDRIEQGMVIGRVGSTGNSTGPHLHFEVRQRTSDGWVAVDPGHLLETALANFSNNLQVANMKPEGEETLVALKNLSKASKAAGTAYSFLAKEESPKPSELQAAEPKQ